MPPDYTIRPAAERDAAELARLFTAFGHPAGAGDIVTRWPTWYAAGNFALVAVRPDGSLAGMATLHHTHVLHRPRPVGRITALIVDEPDRGRGIGRDLVARSEKLLTDAGCGLLEITSNARLVDAHEFYRRLGYEQTSARFMKKLTSTM
jgi:GNAT superfamily N-acetyltransferase